MKRLLVGLLLAVLLQTANFARAALPNFVVIFIDDMGYGDIEPFGSKINKTPHLNRMAREDARSPASGTSCCSKLRKSARCPSTASTSSAAGAGSFSRSSSAICAASCRNLP